MSTLMSDALVLKVIDSDGLDGTAVSIACSCDDVPMVMATWRPEGHMATVMVTMLSP